jgi:Icc protein
MNRRTLLKSAGLLTALGAIPGLRTLAAETTATDKKKKKVLRFAHLTDMHTQPELRATEGVAACLHHLQEQKQGASFILSTGDTIFDALKQPQDRVNLQWKLWHDTLKQENSLPIEYCIGNHDCWGFGQKEDPLYGKKYALDQFQLQKPYRSFDKAGWHFIILDSIQTRADGTWYTTYLDEVQYNWLEQDLANTPATTPVLVASHVPIVSAASVVTDNKFKPDQGYVISGSVIHSDAARIISLFDKHPNVKLCLSGHIHLYEQIQYNGVTYISNGAVSGNWWKGIRYRTDNGYALVTLYNDGSFDNEYVTYGWKA